MAPSLVVHGHFYQPPRENPWTEEVAPEPSAAPFHDWNERIAAESYRPNAYARVVDGTGRVVQIVNNYEHLSFNVGPTLLHWLESHAPDAYARIVEADRAGQGAIAQPWFHVILPLSTERDARTNVRWGIADFRHRFGREPRGMWLPETAVDEDVLALLVEEGIEFTILAPGQAAEPQPPDTTHPYRWEHPDGSGRGLDVVYYDGDLSHAVAFENPPSEALIGRVLDTAEDGLVTIATDGETFGHHHRYADRALAYALTVEGPRRGVDVTTTARFLDAHPPTRTTRVRRSAWSCAHGVGRWLEDCGCSTGGEPGWNQAWRGPLRDALDLVRDAAEDVFERRGEDVLKDPWRARDEYVHVLLGAVTRDAFAAEHVVGDDVEAFTLLEVQRHALAMYTSCGWFFNDLAGIETIYVLRLAARLLDLLRDLGEDASRAERDLLAVLATARSNDGDEGDGARIWRRHVVTARVDAERVVAHLALVELLRRPLPHGPIAGFDVEWLDHDHRRRGALALATGRLALTSVRTGRRTEHVYAALHLGGLEVLGATRPADFGQDEVEFRRLHEAFDAAQPVTRLLRLVGDGFGPTEFDLAWALPGHAEEILASVGDELVERFSSAYEQLFRDNSATLDALASARYRLPAAVRAPIELALSRRFEAVVDADADDPDAHRAAGQLAELARRHGVRFATHEAQATASRTILAAVQRAIEQRDRPSVDRALELLWLAEDLDLHPDVDRAQELVYDAMTDGASTTAALRPLGTALRLAVDSLGDPR